MGNWCGINHTICEYATSNHYCSVSACLNNKLWENNPQEEKSSTWHTGTPTEEGWYFCLVDTGSETRYMANEWKNIIGYQWVYAFLGEVIAWRKEEDPVSVLNKVKPDLAK